MLCTENKQKAQPAADKIAQLPRTRTRTRTWTGQAGGRVQEEEGMQGGTYIDFRVQYEWRGETKLPSSLA